MKVHIKVWTTDLKEFETFVFPVQDTARDELVRRFVQELKMRFPNNDLRVIRIGKDRFNVIPHPVANA